MFDNTRWNVNSARKWLSMHGYRPIKGAHITDNYIHYRIKEPDRTKRSRNIPFGQGIKAVAQF